MLTKQIILFLTCSLLATECQRRIINGKNRVTNKGYMVYLAKSPSSPQENEAWLCGGALVTSKSIITSAACIEDVKLMYAIAGYVKYVRFSDIDKDPCTNAVKRKIIHTCVPKNYEFSHIDKVEKWSFIDIAVAKVDIPYDFEIGVVPGCSYRPQTIPVNFEKNFQKPDINAFVLGWGHLDDWKKPGDHNLPMLQFASTTIQNKKRCKEQYSNISTLLPIIDKYMICAYGDDKTKDLTTRSPKPVDVCENALGLTTKGKNCTRTRSNADIVNQLNSTKYRGVCQNDHGGPLVAFVGAHETLLGVASIFLIDEESQCTGSNLFTSTECNSAFLNCALKTDSDWVDPTTGIKEAASNELEKENTTNEALIKGSEIDLSTTSVTTSFSTLTTNTYSEHLTDTTRKQAILRSFDISNLEEYLALAKNKEENLLNFDDVYDYIQFDAHSETTRRTFVTTVHNYVPSPTLPRKYSYVTYRKTITTIKPRPRQQKQNFDMTTKKPKWSKKTQWIRPPISSKNVQWSKKPKSSKNFQWNKTPKLSKTVQWSKAPKFNKNVQWSNTAKLSNTLQRNKSPILGKTSQWRKTPQRSKMALGKIPQSTKMQKLVKKPEWHKKTKWGKQPQFKTNNPIQHRIVKNKNYKPNPMFVVRSTRNMFANRIWNPTYMAQKSFVNPYYKFWLNRVRYFKCDTRNIDCAINYDMNSRAVKRSRKYFSSLNTFCNLNPQKDGFQIVSKYILWPSLKQSVFPLPYRNQNNFIPRSQYPLRTQG